MLFEHIIYKCNNIWKNHSDNKLVRISNEFIKENNLHRVFSKKLKYITHRLTLGQLDHILITKDVFKIKSKLVLPSIHKSDHRALSFVFEFKESTQ